MSQMSTNESPRTDKVVIRRHPFNSSEARYLIPLLDADLAAMYPDWDELAHPSMHHENNPRPPPVISAEEVVAGTTDSESSDLFFFVAFATSTSAIENTNVDPDNAQTGVAVGCGALRLLPQPLPTGLDPKLSYVEVKRMYVKHDWRGRGISKTILAELERYAKVELKVDRLVMETGLRQEAAVGLYRGADFIERAMFGQYIGADPANGGDSICLEKALR